MTPASTVLISGHLVDAPDRPVARFPQRLVDQVSQAVAAVFDRWRVGPGSVIICGGARGADIIGAEAGLARGARVVVILALPADAFEATSVALPGTEWAERYRRLLAVAEVRQPPPSAAQERDVFAHTNQRMVDAALARDPQPKVLLVWDGKTGDGPGGTADLVTRLGYRTDDPHVHIINPTSI